MKYNKILFNKPCCIGNEESYIDDSIKKAKISGDGYYTGLCTKWFLKEIDRRILLTHSCTAALEMAAILTNIKEGDEVIVPSFTFVSTANAFVLRGAKPVFVDIRYDTLNIDETLIDQAITPMTKAIVPVHYAGVGCEMDTIISIANQHNLYVIEDAAQAFGSKYKDRHLGTLGDLGTYSFHETKNIISGEGGALIVNNEMFYERAEIIREKGTTRSKFFRGEVDRYTWRDIGSSYLPSDMIAAFLYAQLEGSEKIQNKRLSIWMKYNEFFSKYEKQGILRRPFIPESCTNNAHMYYILLKDEDITTKFLSYLKLKGIYSVFHYIPLHSSPAGIKYGRTASKMDCTNKVSNTLVRMPLFYELTDYSLEYIFEIVDSFFKRL